MLRFLSLLAFVLALAPVAAAQSTSVRVALTCQRVFCDAEFQRTELAFLTFVREPGDADVQALVSSDGNGGGGETYSVRLIGRGRFDGKGETYTLPFAPDATDDAKRRGLARVLAAGLMPFVAQSGGLDNVTIAGRTGLTAGAETATPAVPERDPWNRWVFSATAASNFNGDENRTSLQSRFYGSASRVTDGLIARVFLNGNRSLDRFNVDSVTTVRDERRSASLGTLVATSIGPKMTAGVEANVSTSTFNNKDLGVSAEVGVERSLYPYSQSTERLVTLRYGLAAEYVDYRDTTIYDQTAEALFAQKVRLGVDMRQPWGTVFLAVSGSHYLNHPDMYSISPALSVDVRVAKGLSVGAYGVLDITRDLRQISRKGASRDDVLLQRRALQSGYNYFGGVGVRYTFGSKLAGVVNNRYQDGYSISFSY